MARICLISPGHLSTNPRLVKEADALQSAGHDVQVIAADYVGWARRADEEFANRSWRLAARVPFGPDAPATRRGLHWARRRAARALWSAGLRRDGILRAAWHPIGPELARAAKRVEADLYVAHYPAALPAAAHAAAARGARYAFDAEDFHLGDPPESEAFDELRAMVRAIESRYLPGCAYVSAASPGIADAYQQAYGIARPVVIFNVFPLSEAPAGPTARGSVRPGPSVYWFSQTIGPDRGLECLVQAIGRSRSAPHAYLQGNLQPGFGKELAVLAAAAGAQDRVHCLDPERPSDLVRRAATFDLGFVGETGCTPNRRIALTNKLFAYWLAGLPCVASDIPPHRALAAEAGPAMACFPVDDADALAAALDGLLDAGDGGLAEARNQAWSLAQRRFNWDVEKASLIHCVDGALQS